MNSYIINGKSLPIPSFFQVYNYGGGNGDKDREIVYAELTKDTPALINYYYINNRYKHVFQSKYFDQVDSYERIGDLYNHIRNELINEKKEVYCGYKISTYDFNDKVFLLDSGAGNIVKYIAKEVDYDQDRFKSELMKHMKEYYDFANKLKVDLVVSFDLGGKYTHKDGEKTNDVLMDFLSDLDSETINNELLRETAKYLASKEDFYPGVMATVHGVTIKEYSASADYITTIEKTYNYKFWGFALGGIASYKQLDDSWFDGISQETLKGYKDTVGPAKASQCVRTIIGNRPIHALGCGGYPNIAMNYFFGATSFDSATPVRRVGDGSKESAKIVHDKTPSKLGFSKYFVGGINMDNTMREYPCSYIKLNEVDNQMPLCGCPACQKAGDIINIKNLYGAEEEDKEANFYSRQLIGLHAVMQHRKLCDVVSQYASIEDFVADYPNELNLGLLKLYTQIKDSTY